MPSCEYSDSNVQKPTEEDHNIWRISYHRWKRLKPGHAETSSSK